MRRYLRRLFLFGCLLYLTLWAISIYLKKKVTQNNENKIYWAFNKTGENYDMAFLGSSRVFLMVDVDTIEKHLGVKAINLGKDGSGAADQYLILHGFLKNNTIKKLVFQIDFSTVGNTFSYPFHEYDFLPYLSDDPIISKVIRDHSDRIKFLFWKYLPFSFYVEYSKLYRFKSGKSDETSPFDKTKGTLFMDLVFDTLKTPPQRDIFPDKQSISYIYKIMELCRRNNIEIYFYRAPVYHSTFHYLKPHTIDSVIDKLVKQNVYIDFTKCDIAYDERYFYNYTHFNRWGTKQFTVLLADSLRKYMNAEKELKEH